MSLMSSKYKIKLTEPKAAQDVEGFILRWIITFTGKKLKLKSGGVNKNYRSQTKKSWMIFICPKR